MDIKIANSDEELHKIAPVLLQLRPAFNEESLIARIKSQADIGYRIAYIEIDNQAVCVAGFVSFEKLAWCKGIYIDDLVTDENHRSSGAGKAMLDWFKRYARENGLAEIHLDSGAHRKDAHRFYAREQFDNTGFHFAFTKI